MSTTEYELKLLAEFISEYLSISMNSTELLIVNGFVNMNYAPCVAFISPHLEMNGLTRCELDYGIALETMHDADFIRDKISALVSKQGDLQDELDALQKLSK